MTNITEEIWKDIPEFIGYYQASNLGRVRRLDTIVKHSLGGPKRLKSKIIKQSINPRTGYLGFDSCVNGVKVTRNAHSVTAKAFLTPVEGKTHVNHINGIKTDNRVENLEWVTVSENRIHAIKSGLCDDRFGTDSIIDQSKADTIRELSKNGYNQFEIADKFGLNQCTVSRVINRKRQYSKF